jgi:hypothetical protein
MAFLCWFFYTEIQQRMIEQIYYAGLHLTNNKHLWDDVTVHMLSREFILYNYIFKYRIKVSKHLEVSPEANQYQLTFTSYLIVKSPQKNWYIRMGLRKNNKFLNRLSQRAQHLRMPNTLSKLDLIDLEEA